MHTLALEFLANIEAALVEQLPVKGGSGIDASGEDAGVRGLTDSKRSILKTKTGEVESFNSNDVALELMLEHEKH